MIVACVAGFMIAVGLYRMTSWGYWLTLVCVSYLLIVPPALVGKDISPFGNIFWPLIVIVYLIAIRKKYFRANQNP